MAGDIRYLVCGATDVPEVIGLLARAFSHRDPPAVALGLTEDDFKPFLAAITANTGKDGLSIIARDVASGEMAGVALTEDAGAPAAVDLDVVSPRFAALYDLFGVLEAAIDTMEPIERGSVLHLFMLGVDERFAGLGIAKHLVEACVANGAALGYRMAMTEATGLVSQHIFTKLGFETRAEVSYADYRRDGGATFASLADQGGIKSMIRQPLQLA